LRTLAAAVAALAAALLLTIAGPAVPPAGAAEPGIEADFVSGLNRVRADAGLPPLEVHGELVAVARGWADTMASAGEIWHNPNVGSQVGAPWVLLGENVGVGYDVPTLVQAFVDSAAHYRNIVDPRFDWVGVGVTWGPDGRMFTAHVFMDLGAPAPVSAPAPAPSTAAPVAVAEPAPAPPPAAAVPERVQAVLTAVAALGADGVS
jgi:uncharacterized protein YkwD